VTLQFIPCTHDAHAAAILEILNNETTAAKASAARS